jgi:hypothetical protein
MAYLLSRDKSALRHSHFFAKMMTARAFSNRQQAHLSFYTAKTQSGHLRPMQQATASRAADAKPVPNRPSS